MRMFKKNRHIAAAATLIALLLPLSLFADSRRLARTNVQRERSLRGTITSIDRRSDVFELATFDGRRVWVDARDADRDERLRVGDQVFVSGFIDRDNTFIASSVSVDEKVLRDRRHHGDDDDEGEDEDEDDND